MRFDRHNVSINTATLGYQRPIAETIEAIAGAGFAGIAPWRREVEGHDVGAIARRIKDAGLRVSGYCRSSYFPAPDRERWTAAVEDNRRALDDAATLMADCFVLVVGGLPEGSKDLPGARKQVEDGIAALHEQAQAVGVPLAIEPLHPMYAADRSCVNTIGDALAMCAAIDPTASGFLGVAIDVYHTWWDPNVQQAIRDAGAQKRLLAYHVNDWRQPTVDMLMDRGFPNEGVIDLAALSSIVDATGYSGLTEIEIFSERCSRMHLEDILKLCTEICIK